MHQAMHRGGRLGWVGFDMASVKAGLWWASSLGLGGTIGYCFAHWQRW